MRSILVLALGLLFLTCGCSRIKSRYDEVKESVKEEINAALRTDFYSDYGAWDFYRVPLIAPYELTAIDDRNIWKCEKRRDIDKFDYYPSVAESGFKPFQYDNGDDYVSDGRYRIVDKDGKIGYATEDNAVIISPRFAFGFPFKNGRAKVTDSGHLEEVKGSDREYHYWVSDNWYWIDKMGNRLGMENEADR